MTTIAKMLLSLLTMLQMTSSQMVEMLPMEKLPSRRELGFKKPGIGL